MWSNFDGLLERKEPFRMEDGSERFIKTSNLQVLAEILKKEKEKVQKYVNKILKNNY